MADSPAATGKSVRHIDNLIRFYRVLPDALRKAWAADRDQRFTFAVLRELAVAAQSGDDAAVRGIVERTLGGPAQVAAVGGTPRAGVVRRLGHASTTKLQRRLEAARIDRLHSDDRAELVYDLLRAINGEVDAVNLARRTRYAMMVSIHDASARASWRAGRRVARGRDGRLGLLA